MVLHHLRFGKKPARPGAYKLKFSDYFHLAKLPTPPAVFGHQKLVPTGQWGMLGNDQYGDCVWAGGAHEEIMEHAEGGNGLAQFTNQSVLSDYAAVTGFNPNDPSTDQGTDMATAAEYRRTTGLLDATGKRHKVDAYLEIKTGDVAELSQAAYIFSAVGIGINVPDFAMSQFNANQPWHLPAGWQSAQIEGGHYIPVVGRDVHGYLLVVTWGKVQQMTNGFFQAYNDEAIAYVNLEILNAKGLSPEGYNQAQLESDLKELTT